MGVAPCVSCGASASLVTCERDGESVASAWVCAACLAAALDELERYRLEFDEMIAAGVSRAEADRVMVARVTGSTERIA